MRFVTFDRYTIKGGLFSYLVLLLCMAVNVSKSSIKGSLKRNCLRLKVIDYGA